MPISKQMATTAKEDAQPPILLAVKFFTDQLEAGHPVSFCACANKFGLCRETLCQCIAGRKTHKKANDDMAWFTPEEDQVLIKFLMEIAEHGFPDTKWHLKECVNIFLRAKKGDPTFSVGINWVDHWLEYHNDQLRKYWTTSLDNVHAKALNPATVSDYFSKVHKVLTEHKIDLIACGQWMKNNSDSLHL
jgi:hypothetical protein